MNNSNVAHLWAAQGKPGAKGSNLFFEGPVIFSYGHHFPIANIIPATKARPRVILFTSRDYSVTTAKHKGQVRRAIPDSDICFTVPKVRADFGGVESIDHNANARYLRAQVIEAQSKALRATKYAKEYADSAREALEALRGYLGYFGRYITPNADRAALRAFARKPLWTARELAKIGAKIERGAALEAAREAREAAKRAEAAKELIPALEAWAAGTGEYRSGFYNLPCRLRVVMAEHGPDRIVETSHGANVPLAAAIMLLGAWQAGAVELGAKIGPYTVEAVTPELITIGCHKIDRVEAERVIVPAASIR